MTCAAAASGSLSPRAAFFTTEDRNGDRRPDVWRVYDRQGQLSEVVLDTNFDGRADVYEYYEGGVLIRRQEDRDFNDQVDLVEDFGPATRGRVRAVEDVDYDGTADLLVLFQGWPGRLLGVGTSGYASRCERCPSQKSQDRATHSR